MSDEDYTPAQQALIDALERHRVAELEELDVAATLKTMVDEPYILILPNMCGGDDQNGVRDFYTLMLDQLPQDMEWIFVSRTVGNTQIVIESVLAFTHDIQIDWVFPKLPPTNKPVRIPLVIVFSFENGKLASERLYWDQASALVQLEVLDPTKYPIVGGENAEKLLSLTNAPQAEDKNKQVTQFGPLL